LNLRPSGYEPDELPGCSTPRQRAKGAGSRKSETRTQKEAVLTSDFRLLISGVKRKDPFFAGLATTYSPVS
jgi:hypothetical protein